MRYLLDTNVCVMYLNGRSTSLSNRLLSIPTDEIAICSIVNELAIPPHTASLSVGRDSDRA
ncbi:hypothetical protein ACQ4M3_22280 [Leptolyngbya sp. AN03gr2]|uniref:hypothetical protein n=1 Tax=unclassified Leptolyngbya TaxID=2650499 RepID=UPI003D31270B